MGGAYERWIRWESVPFENGIKRLLVLIREKNVVGAQLGDLFGETPVEGDGAAGGFTLGEVLGVRGDCWADGFVLGFLREEVVVGVNKISVDNDEVGLLLLTRLQKDTRGGLAVWSAS